MKKLLTIVMALMLSFAVSAFAAEDEEMCPSCAKAKCSAPRLCKADQAKCVEANPCNVLINICNCGPGTFWNDGDQVGIRVESLTPGVYFNEDCIKARLFKYKETTTVTVANGSMMAYMRGKTPNAVDLGRFYDGTAAQAGWPTPSAVTGSYTFKELGACEFLKYDLQTNANRRDANADDFDPADLADGAVWVLEAWMPNTYTAAAGPGRANYIWCGADSLTYFDVDGDQIIDPTGFKGGCDLEAGMKVDMVQTSKDSPWVLDVTNTAISTTVTHGDNDADTVDSEDQGDYLAVQVPGIRVDWSEVEAADLKGTTAMGNVCILNVKGATSGLCTDCAIICCCPIELVKLCPPSRDDCIYFPYAIYGQAEDGWLTGLAISNISFDNSVAAGEDTPVPIADMSVDITIVDQTGAVFTATFAEFDKAIQSFTADSLINEVLELEGVAPGSVYIKVQANFDIDGYEFNLYNAGGVSFGAGVLPRACVWSYADVMAADNADKIAAGLDML